MALGESKKRNIDNRLTDLETGGINERNISYRVLRKKWGEDSNLWGKLEYGRKLLRTQEELDQYLFSYGPMTERQWSVLLEEFQCPSSPFQIIDYGAGQGLATIHLLDRLIELNSELPDALTLVDLSEIALERAEKLLTCYKGGAARSIVRLRQNLSNIRASDLRLIKNAERVHLLSNVVDIPSFDSGKFFKEIFNQPGMHQVLAVSPSRDFTGGDARFEEFSELFETERTARAGRLDGEFLWRQFKDFRGMVHSIWWARYEVNDGPV